jgi:hypothetical protein
MFFPTRFPSSHAVGYYLLQIKVEDGGILVWLRVIARLQMVLNIDVF